MRIGIVGASGYVGGELLRILLSHPDAEVVCATSRRYAGEYVYRVHPNLRGLTDLQFIEQDMDKVAGRSDFVFTALPHGSSVEVISKLASIGLKIVDMSADFRLKRAEDYQTWYGYIHPHPELLEKFTYGVPELHREEIRASSLVSSPGCMAITSILAAAPLIRGDAVDREHIVIDAKIGSSGGGLKATSATHHSERYGVVRPYKPVGHRHTAEIEQELTALAGSKVTVCLSAHAVNMVRGILCTIHTFTRGRLTIPDLWRIYRGAYGGEPFIRLLRDKQGIYRFPDPKIVVGSNYCDIGFELDDRAKRVVVMASTDNLVKGAAGNGVQCMNIMLRFDESAGLRAAGLHPV